MDESMIGHGQSRCFDELESPSERSAKRSAVRLSRADVIARIAAEIEERCGRRSSGRTGDAVSVTVTAGKSHRKKARGDS